MVVILGNNNSNNNINNGSNVGNNNNKKWLNKFQVERRASKLALCLFKYSGKVLIMTVLHTHCLNKSFDMLPACCDFALGNLNQIEN